MHLISSGRVTVLSDFADLETKATHQHVNGEVVDFQFYQRQRLFVEVNKKSGFEILRIKELENQEMAIQRVRKLNIDNVYCVACATQSLEVMALGLTNGEVKLYNYKKSEILHRFKADNNRNSVLYLDYNASDEYMSAVFESGVISLYGIKTKIKMNSINIDNNSSLSRFHPTKRFQLSIASFKGAVTVYDVQSKRKLFHSTDAHASPCRDLCMSAASPDTMITVGYDCVINIYDTRRKSQPLQLTQSHPLSTVAMSECGTFFCVGNLKGELIKFDMRQTKSALATKKVHEGAVNRIAFVPMENGEGANSFCPMANYTANSTENVGQSLAQDVAIVSESSTPSVVTPNFRDSIFDFIDNQVSKEQDKTSTRLTKSRESFDWNTLQSKPSSDGATRASLVSNGVNLSTVGSSTNMISCNSDSFDGKANRLEEKALQPLIGPALHENCNTNLVDRITSNLKQIEEEPQQLNNSADSDKENPTSNLELGSRLRILPGNRNSTPTTAISPIQMFMPSNNINAIQTSTPVNGGQASSTSILPMDKQIADLRAEINTRFQQLETELKFNAETNKWQIFKQTSNIANQHLDYTLEIRDALGLLMKVDPFVIELERLREENEELKAKLWHLTKK